MLLLHIQTATACFQTALRILRRLVQGPRSRAEACRSDPEWVAETYAAHVVDFSKLQAAAGVTEDAIANAASALTAFCSAFVSSEAVD